MVDKRLALRRYDCHYATMITSIFSRALYENELMNRQYGAKIKRIKRPASLFLRIAYTSAIFKEMCRLKHEPLGWFFSLKMLTFLQWKKFYYREEVELFSS